MKFDAKWADKKLNMKRRRKELAEYINLFLPELRKYGPGAVLDIGCGPGDFIHECNKMGHRGIGIDAQNGEGGMGDPYLDACAVKIEQFGVEVRRYGLEGLLADSKLKFHLEMEKNLRCINMRGSIEQAFSFCMVGEPHDSHHDCRLLDWDTEHAYDEIYRVVEYASEVLAYGGCFLVHANGTKSTDEWYSSSIRKMGMDAGLTLTMNRGSLLHKWVKK